MNFNIVKDNGDYVVADHVQGEWTYSVTVLHPDKETNGHKHDCEESYSFLSGYGEIVLDGAPAVVGKGTSLWVQPNTHHQVRNLSKLEPLVFACIWKGKREMN